MGLGLVMRCERCWKVWGDRGGGWAVGEVSVGGCGWGGGERGGA